MQTLDFVISSDVEFDTGFSNDLLRKWRQRYGFPLLVSLTDKKTGYSRDTVKHLLLIKRLLEGGFQPAQVVGKPLDELNRLQLAIASILPQPELNESSRQLIEKLKKSDLRGFHTLLIKERAQMTLGEFVAATVAPLLVAVGDACSRGEIEIYHEHLCTSIIERYLHTEILSSKHKRDFPTIIFATAPDEHHALGLLMSEAVLAGQGAHTINLGSNIPLNDLKLAAISCHADAIALSFSFAYSTRRIRPILIQLRHILPLEMELWAGGKGASIIRFPIKGIHIFLNLADAIVALNQLVAEKHPSPSSS